MYFSFYSGFLSNLRLPWKTEGAQKCLAVLNIFFIIQEFWVTCAFPENRVALEFFTVFNILFTFRIFEQLALALKNRGCPEFTVLNVNCLLFRIFEQLACACPENRVVLEFSLYWNIFYYSGFLSNLRLPWKQSLPWNFSSPGYAYGLIVVVFLLSTNQQDSAKTVRLLY